MTFASAYRLVWDLAPGAPSNLPAAASSWEAYGSMVYFSFVTLTSVGYGDIVPVHLAARALSNLEAIVGQRYLATLLARLVTLELDQRPR